MTRIEPYWDNGVVQLYHCDAREIPLLDQSVHCVVTSPPYLGLRVYQGVSDQGIGLEASVGDYVANLVDVFREVWRVLRDDGVLWLKVGDSYGGYFGDNYAHKPFGEDRTPDASTPPNKPSNGPNAGNRLGIPERVVLALQSDGWVWRDTVIWAKKSAMPESVNGWRWGQCRAKVAPRPLGSQAYGTAQDEIFNNHRAGHPGDSFASAEWSPCPGCPKCRDNDGLVLRRGSWRTTSAHEYIFMLTKGMGYYADAEAVKTKLAPDSLARDQRGYNGTFYARTRKGDTEDLRTTGIDGGSIDPSGANRRSVWNDISPEPYSGTSITYVGVDEATDGMKRKASPVCPVHVSHQVPNGPDGVPLETQLIDIPGIDDRLGLTPESEPLPIEDQSLEETENEPVSPGLPSATGHSNMSSRMAPGSGTNPSYSPSAQSLGGIERTEASPDDESQHPDMAESNTSGDSGRYGPDGQTSVHIADTETQEQVADMFGSYTDLNKSAHKTWPVQDGPSAQTLADTPNISSCTCSYEKPVSHYSTFPSDLPRICIQASTSERGVCPECGSQWARVVEAKASEPQRANYHGQGEVSAHRGGTDRPGGYYPEMPLTVAWRATCPCESRTPMPATVLDPFAGTATTCLAAQRLGRRAVGVDLSEDYLKQAVKRLEALTLPMGV